jgi:hypothetical protein
VNVLIFISRFTIDEDVALYYKLEIKDVVAVSGDSFSSNKDVFEGR